MKTNFLKLGLALVAILTFSLGNAQQTTGNVGKGEDVSQSSVLDGTIRVIDNKGTKKFLQVKNGLTLLTDATPDGGYVSTWQLGGTLTDDTYITADGNIFALDGLSLETGAASVNAIDGDNAQPGTTTATGWTLIVRDEATGELRKLAATDLIQSGQEAFTATAGQTAYALTGAPVLPAFEQVYVYRNGAKLVANVDYTVSGSTVTLDPTGLAPNDWAVLAGDVIEVQFVK
ncbi:MAG: hypothetical protein HKP48_10840 [Winogradskyella sp.]|uniref:hypothetical protein n=1 Tax=Winogradskyella sp. TaxID=1883156 RepID=UPI001855CF05|nr:hypothetical protein [Winogradskyella sp.]MBT8244064.1 hypothetical protein [Winogradskyella sp.]NNK23757.1 hypothetical protein [Winogradskyella sp.]